MEPKDDRLTDKPNYVHEHKKYWWENSYPANGDSPFTDSNHEWEPSSELGSDKIVDECIESATYDPEATLEMLRDRLHPRNEDKL